MLESLNFKWLLQTKFIYLNLRRYVSIWGGECWKSVCRPHGPIDGRKHIGNREVRLFSCCQELYEVIKSQPTPCHLWTQQSTHIYKCIHQISVICESNQATITHFYICQHQFHIIHEPRLSYSYESPYIRWRLYTSFMNATLQTNNCTWLELVSPFKIRRCIYKMCLIEFIITWYIRCI